MPDQERVRPRRGPVRMVRGIPYSDPATTLSLLPGAAVGEWLHAQRHLVRGRLLDSGCGNRPYEPWYRSLADSAVALDAAPIEGVDVVGMSDRLPFADGSFDTVLCTEVLEHVDDAERAADEIHRVLRPGGHALVTVPFLYPVHEAPYDFRRLTHFGLRRLFERRGFDVLDLSARGGVVRLVLHFLVLGLSGALDAVGGRLGRRQPLTGTRAVRGALVAPQQALLRVRTSPRAVRGSAFRVSMGYMIAVRRPTAEATGRR